MTEKKYTKGEHYISEGQSSKKVGFVVQGLFYQYYSNAQGEIVTKYFFPENRLVASVSAMLTLTPSIFTITALENSILLEYDFEDFKNLFTAHPDIALFYIRYIELHWIIEKEYLEVSFRNDTAAKRYGDFLKQYPDLVKRLKKHHIASFLGITPTQFSRIFFAAK